MLSLKYLQMILLMATPGDTSETSPDYYFMFLEQRPHQIDRPVPSHHSTGTVPSASASLFYLHQLPLPFSGHLSVPT